jgi:hypothetical protein
MDTEQTIDDMNVGDKSVAASMAENESVIQTTTPKPKLKRNRTILCVFFYQKNSMYIVVEFHS